MLPLYLPSMYVCVCMQMVLFTPNTRAIGGGRHPEEALPHSTTSPLNGLCSADSKDHGYQCRLWQFGEKSPCHDGEWHLGSGQLFRFIGVESRTLEFVDVANLVYYLGWYSLFFPSSWFAQVCPFPEIQSVKFCKGLEQCRVFK